MRVLFDQGTPVPLRLELPTHDVATAFERGWATLTNGQLLATAEAEGFDVLVTTDRNLRYQQNVANRGIAIVVLSTPSWPRIRGAVDAVAIAIERSVAGSFVEVRIP